MSSNAINNFEQKKKKKHSHSENTSLKSFDFGL